MHWLFFYNAYAEQLFAIDYGTAEEIKEHIKMSTASCPYIRYWVHDNMLNIDFGRHDQFFKVYPAENFIEF